MAFSKTIKNKYSSNATQKVSYIEMPIRIRMVKLFKKLLSIVYKKKEKNILLARI